MKEHHRLRGLLLAAVVATAAWSFTKIAGADIPKLVTESALIRRPMQAFTSTYGRSARPI